MGSLTKQAILEVLKTVELLSHCRDVESLSNKVVELLHGELDCNLVSYNDIDLENESALVVFYPERDDLMKIASTFESLMETHPVMTYMKRTGDGTAWRISDFQTQKAFHQTELYKQLYSMTNTEYQMAISFQPVARRMIGIACNRGEESRDFSETNRKWLNTLRPHLISLWRTAIEMDVLKNNQSLSTIASDLKSSLSKRELQVLDWISEGKTNTAIAERLGLSALTVKTHVQKILRKLDVHTRSEAVRKVYGSEG